MARVSSSASVPGRGTRTACGDQVWYPTLAVHWTHDELKEQYLHDERLAVHSLTGNGGVIGWYVLPWLAEGYPGTDWRKLP